MDDVVKQFEIECDVISLKYEYPNYEGDVKFIIITELTDDALRNKYKNIVDIYSPYIIVGPVFWAIRADFIRNQEKYNKRRIRHENLLEFNENAKMFYSDLYGKDCLTLLIEKEENQEKSEKLAIAFKGLSNIQKRYVFLKYYKGLTERQIANIENKSKSSVHESLGRALNKLKKFYKTNK